MRHLDLFSGIGGFALAAEMVWGKKVQHTFVEYDPFCQAVLKKHWPKARMHGDIRAFVADAKIGTSRHKKRRKLWTEPIGSVDILTGGFPCQPFSTAGRRKGTADDRYLWPPMLECIALFRPRWVIAENVAGLASWNDGMVLETVCADLEKEGYEVCPFLVPAAAVGAPHKRERIWIVAHDKRDAIRQQQGWSSGKGRERKAVNCGDSEDASNAGHAPRRPDTSQCGDAQGVGLRSQRGEAHHLAGAALSMLPTPRAHDGEKGMRSEAGHAGERERRKNGTDLPTAIGRGQQTGLKLQPSFALWMMGFRKDWCDLADGEMPHSKRQAMQSSRKSQRK